MSVASLASESHKALFPERGGKTNSAVLFFRFSWSLFLFFTPLTAGQATGSSSLSRDTCRTNKSSFERVAAPTGEFSRVARVRRFRPSDACVALRLQRFVRKTIRRRGRKKEKRKDNTPGNIRVLGETFCDITGYGSAPKDRKVGRTRTELKDQIHSFRPFVQMRKAK